MKIYKSQLKSLVKEVSNDKAKAFNVNQELSAKSDRLANKKYDSNSPEFEKEALRIYQKLRKKYISQNQKIGKYL